MVNRVYLIGNLGQEPELKTSASGNAVCKLSVATTHSVKRGNEWARETEWHRVVCFGKTAENAAKYLQKGRQVYIDGRISTSKYTDKDGNERRSTEVVANDVRFLGSKHEASGGQNYGGSSKQTDDIPF